MRLDYSTQISPYPIPLSIGTLRKPKLRDIFDTVGNMSFTKLKQFELFLTMTPEAFYTVIMKNESGVELWNSFSKEKQTELKMYDVIISDERLQSIYVEIFDFFFVEKVKFQNNCFILIKDSVNIDSQPIITGIIDSEIYDVIIDFICQICCIKSNDNEKPKFKNNAAKQIYEKIKNDTLNIKKSKETNLNETIPNIISSVVAFHPSISYINVWDLTIFQLLDIFNRMTINSIYKIASMRFSVWGEKEQKFDNTTWFKNYYDLDT